MSAFRKNMFVPITDRNNVFDIRLLSQRLTEA